MHLVIRMTSMQIHECIRIEFRLLLHKYQLLFIKSYTIVSRFAAQPATGNNLLLVSATSRQLSAAATTGTKQQYGGCNPQEVKVYGECGPHEVNVLWVPPASMSSTSSTWTWTYSAIRQDSRAIGCKRKQRIRTYEYGGDTLEFVLNLQFRKITCTARAARARARASREGRRDAAIVSNSGSKSKFQRVGALGNFLLSRSIGRGTREST
jgi:hypothetical protein